MHCVGVTRSPNVPVSNNVKRTGSHQTLLPCQPIVIGTVKLRNAVAIW